MIVLNALTISKIISLFIAFPNITPFLTERPRYGSFSSIHHLPFSLCPCIEQETAFHCFFVSLVGAKKAHLQFPQVFPTNILSQFVTLPGFHGWLIFPRMNYPYSKRQFYVTCIILKSVERCLSTKFFQFGINLLDCRQFWHIKFLPIEHH